MATAGDEHFARHFNQNRIAQLAYEAAGKSFSESIIADPDANLALRLQRMEVMTPMPPAVDEDDSARIAWQIQEQEQFEQEQNDADVAKALSENGEGDDHIQNKNRVPRLPEILQNMQINHPEQRGRGMNFSRSMRGPSIRVPMISESSLDVFGPGSIDEDLSDIEPDGQQSILPAHRPRLELPNMRPTSDANNTDSIDSTLDLPPLPGRFQMHLARRNISPRLRYGYGDINQHIHRGGMPGRILYPTRNHQHNIGSDVRDIDLDDYESLWDLQERNGDVQSKGLTKQQIGQIPDHKYKFEPGLNTTFKSDKNTCSICLSDYQDGERIKTLPCFHAFHKSCIDKWLKSQAVCPVCRGNIKTR